MLKILVLSFLVFNVFVNSASAWWQPKRFQKITWHWQLLGNLDMTKNVDMYDVDLFYTSKDDIKKLKDKGKIVICYFSAGALEFTDTTHTVPERKDLVPFPKPYSSITGNPVEDYPKELWLDIREGEILEKKIKPTINSRFDLAVQKGCDGVEVDNVNEYEVDDDDPTELPVQNESFSPGTTGFNPIVTADDQLKYNIWLSEQAHNRGLSIGFKNNIYQAEQLVNYFDWALNEMCYQYTSEEDEYYECDYYDAFDEANKAVFGVEFNLEKGDFCEKANRLGRYWAKKHLALNEYQDNCEYYGKVLTDDKSVIEGYSPIYRLYNTRTGIHLYSGGKLDANKVLYRYRDFEFTDGAPAFYASLTQKEGLTPIYRLYNKRTGVHLYTRGQEDRDKILKKYKDFEFTDGTPAFYASLTQKEGLTPIYRLYNKRTGVHLYTRGQEDRDKILKKYKDFEFTDGAPVFWASLK